MAQTPVKRVIQQVRPILSLDQEEARRRVFNLYKAWYRSVPFIGKQETWKKSKQMIFQQECSLAVTNWCI